MDSDRLHRVVESLRLSGLDQCLVTHPLTLSYLTDDRSVGAAVVSVDGSVERAPRDASAFSEVPIREPDAPYPVDEYAVGKVLGHVSAGTVGFEDEHLPVRTYQGVRANLDEALGRGSVSLVGVSKLLTDIRLVKDPAEVDAISRAARLADAALTQLASETWIGATERQLAVRLDEIAGRAGSSRPAFPTIVASGPYSALPHARPTDRRIEPSDIVLVDFGCTYGGYASDCTRMFYTGEPPSTFLTVYSIVLRAQEAALAAVGPGVDAASVDSAARDVIDAEGYSQQFGHGLGHGVGLDVHEGPRLTKTSTSVLQSGHVVTVEPGIYLPGSFGVRIEDLVVVTSSSYDNLVSFPKATATAVH